MGLFNKDSQITPTTRLVVFILTGVAWLLGICLFIIGILLITGVFGNSHEFVIEAMNCNDPEKSSVGCSRVFGYRAEGVVVIILSFFFVAWAVLLTIAVVVVEMRRGHTQPQRVVLGPGISQTQYATSEA